MANFLKSLFVKGIEIDPAGATSAQVLSYNGTKFVPAAAAAGGSSVTVSDTAPVSPTAGDVWYESDTGILFVRYDSYWVEVGGAGSSTTATTSATDLTSGTLNNARLPAAATTITSVGTLGSLTVTNATTSGSYLQGTDYLSPYQGFRNKIINGDFSIWQRGTGSTALAATASTSFLADRWSGYRATSNSTQTQISSGLAGFQYALRIQRNSGLATNKIYIGQSFETSSIATFAGKTMVVSFYARAGSNFSAASSLFTLNVYSGTGTECNVVYVAPTGLTTDLSTTFTLTTSWQRFSASYNVPSSVTQHGLEFNFLPVGTAGGNDYVDITGLQLEQGSVATPFEYRPIGVELALCQRYLMKWSVMENSGRLAHGIASSTTSVGFGLPYKVQPRKHLGTLTVEGALTISDSTATFTPSSYSRFDVVCADDYYGITVVTSGVTTYRTYYLEGNGNSAANIRSDMEL